MRDWHKMFWVVQLSLTQVSRSRSYGNHCNIYIDLIISSFIIIEESRRSEWRELDWAVERRLANKLITEGAGQPHLARPTPRAVQLQWFVQPRPGAWMNKICLPLLSGTATADAIVRPSSMILHMPWTKILKFMPDRYASEQSNSLALRWAYLVQVESNGSLTILQRISVLFKRFIDCNNSSRPLTRI